jgi:hypothetical protein
MSHLLGVNHQEKLPDIFREMYNLYSKRSKVVQGDEDVELNDRDIHTFRNYLNEAIKIFIHVEMSKVELLQLLDEAVFDLVKKEQLGKKVSEAMTKW